MIGLNKTGDIYRPTRAVNSTHEKVETVPATPTYASVACRITAAPRTEGKRITITDSGKATVITEVLLFEAGTDVAVNDLFKYGSDYYRVLAAEDVDQMGHHIEALAVHVKGVT